MKRKRRTCKCGCGDPVKLGGDLFIPTLSIKKKLGEIEEYYLHKYQDKGIPPLPKLDHKEVIKELYIFREATNLLHLKTILSNEFLCFEAAQGLMLDQDYGDFPYVTRSKTGIDYAANFCSGLGIDIDKTIYVTRAYNTRHGAGPLRGEGKMESFSTGIDVTNIYNSWQDSLRFAPINLDRMSQVILKDRDIYNRSEKIRMMTHLDTIPEETRSIIFDDEIRLSKGAFIGIAEYAYDIVSYGPRRWDVELTKELSL